MNKITGPRGSGKTTKLLELAAENDGIVVSFNTQYMRRMVQLCDLKKVRVVSYDMFLSEVYQGYNRGRKYYIDELECFLHYLGVEGYTAREEEG